METPEDIQRLLGDAMRQLTSESLRVIAVNTKLRVLAVEEVSRGTVNETIAHPRDIFRVALTHQAYAIAVVHNHPSGDPSPSGADIEMTRRMRDAAELLQIVLLDHIILGTAGDGEGKGYYSFKEAGYL
jgi:DNA repair protein RadC